MKSIKNVKPVFLWMTALAFMLTAFICVGAEVKADGDVKSITFTPSQEISIIEGTNGYDNEEGEGQSYYRYNINLFTEGSFLTVEDNDGNTKEYYFENAYYDEEAEEWRDACFRNEEGTIPIYAEDGVNFSDDQSENHWDVGVHQVTVTYMGVSTTVDVTIIENPVASISFELAQPIEIVKNTHGYEETIYYEEGEDHFYRYNVYPFTEGSTLTVVDKSGNSKVYKYEPGYNEEGSGEWHSACYKNGEDIISIDQENGISYKDDQSENHWDLGDHEGTINYMGRTAPVGVSIIENPVASISFEPAQPIEIVKNTHGYEETIYYEEGENHFYRYNVYPFTEGSTLTVVDKSGNSKVYKYEPGYNEEGSGEWHSACYKNGEDIISIDQDDGIRYSDDQFENHWDLGEHEGTITYMGSTAPVGVSIIESPVASFSLKLAQDIEIIEETHGYNATNWDSEEGEEYYHYDVNPFTEGSVLTVVDKEGKSKEYTYGRYQPEKGSWSNGYINGDDVIPLYNEDGIRVDDDQYTNHWSVGKNRGKLTYMGITSTFDVTIVPNPVKSIEFTPQEGGISVVENVNGYMETDEETGEEYFNYSVRPFQPGSSLTVKYTDGSERIYKHRWSEGEDRYAIYVWTDTDGTEDVIRTDWDEEYGIRLYYYSNQSEKHWTRDSDNELTISYLNRTCPVPVSVVENLVDSIEFTHPDGGLELIENGDGEYNRGEDGEQFFDYYAYPFSEGTSLTVHFKDGSKKEYEYKWVATSGDYGYECYVNKNDPEDVIRAYDSLYGIDYYSDQYEKHWTRDSENELEIRYMGCTDTLPVTIVENPVKSIKFIPGKEIKLAKDVNVIFYKDEGYQYAELINHSDTFAKISENAKLEVTYSADNSKKTFTYDSKKRAFVNGNEEYDIDDWLDYYPKDNGEKWKVGSGNELVVSFYWKETTIDVSVVENDQPDKVAEVKALIDNLNEKDANYAAKVKAAKAAYNALSKEEQAQLDQATKDKLNAAVAKVEKDEADRKKAEEAARKKAEEAARKKAEEAAKNPTTALNVIDSAVVLKKGSSKTITVEVTEKDTSKATTDAAKLTSSKPGVATASGSNLVKGKLTFKVKGVKKGTANITVNLGSITAKVKVTVLDKANKVKSVKPAKKTKKVKKGKIVSITFNVKGKNAKFPTTDKVTASSSKKGVAAVRSITTKKGKVIVKVKGLQKGKSNLNLKVGGKKAKVKVNVK